MSLLNVFCIETFLKHLLNLHFYGQIPVTFGWFMILRLTDYDQIDFSQFHI